MGSYLKFGCTMLISRINLIKLFLINKGIIHDDNIHPKTFANPRY